jgi:hypothetical protein
MLKAFTLLALISASGCSLAETHAAPAPPQHPTAAQRAVRTLEHARFGPYVGETPRPQLRDIRCAGTSANRVRCHAAWDEHPTAPIVFGVKPNGVLYILVAGPLAIS